jgi:hypothetical protein
MALAYLKLLDNDNNKYRFLLDTGTSVFYELVIGIEKLQRNGIWFVDNVQRKTGMKELPAKTLQTAREIELDAGLFENDNRFVQLFTYSSKDKKGVTFSEVVEVKPKLFYKKNYSEDLPDIKVPKFLSMSASYPLPGRIAQSFSEKPMSESMFFAALLPMLTSILPIAGKLLGGLGGAAAGGGGGGILSSIVPLLGNLLGGLGGGGGATTGGGSGAAAPGGVNIAELLKPETINAVKGLIDQFTQKGNMPGTKSVSDNVSPAVMKLTPLMAPILEKMLTPEAITSLGADPKKLYTALADGIAHLPAKDLLTIKDIIQQSNAGTYVVSKSTTSNYSQPMFWQALLSMLTPDMVNAIGNQATNIKKEQARFVEALIPKGDINQPVIKDMIGAISQYNLLTNQPQAPQQAVAQSIAAFTNAFCQVAPLIEKAMTDENITDEIQDKTKDLTEKIQNQFMQLQEEIKDKMLKSMKEKIEEQVENIKLQSLSLQFSNQNRHQEGLNIFNCKNGRRQNEKQKAVAMAMSSILPIAFSRELKKTDSIIKRKSSFKKLRSGSNDPAVALMLGKIEEAKQHSYQTISFAYDNRFSLFISGAKTIAVNAVQKVVYLADKSIRFAVTIESVKNKSANFPKGLIQVQIKSSLNNKIMADKKFRIGNTVSGDIIDNIIFEAADLEKLPLHSDLLVCFTLLWKDKAGAIKGNRKCHSIMLTNGYLFNGQQSILKSGIPLNDVQKYRDYWHKIWENKKTNDRQKTKIDCKYYMQYNPVATQNNQVETKVLAKKGKEVSDSEYETNDDFVKIKTGLQLSPISLSKLVAQVSNYPMLNEAQLNALKNNEVKKMMDSAGTGHAEFRVKRGETCSLWVYPEVDLVELGFKKAATVNSYGNVLDVVDEKAVFVKPVSLHFIGTKN